jgi:hypothetical protein
MHITINLSKRLLLTLPVALVALVAAVWGGAALASSTSGPTSLTVCAKAHGPLTAVSAGESCSANETAYVLVTQDALDALDGRVSTLESQVASLKTDDDSSLQDAVSTLQSDDAANKSLLAGVSRTTFYGADTLQFSGMNVQVVNGTGSTETVNGLGNLIVGYDTPINVGLTTSGSHNIVVGEGNNFSSFGGLVAGAENLISAEDAVVTGGERNTASGFASSVSGGAGNTAGGVESSVSGGVRNTAGGEGSSVSGGFDNTAGGLDSSILGGSSVTVSNLYETSP